MTQKSDRERLDELTIALRKSIEAFQRTNAALAEERRLVAVLQEAYRHLSGQAIAQSLAIQVLSNMHPDAAQMTARYREKIETTLAEHDDEPMSEAMRDAFLLETNGVLEALARSDHGEE